LYGIALGYVDPVTRKTGSPEPDGTRVWRTADLGGLELLRASVSDFSFRPHAHGEFFIALTERGLATPVYRGGRHVIGPGEMIVLNPEEAHAGGPPPGRSWTYRALYLPADLMSQVMTEFPPGPRAFRWLAADVVRDPQVIALLLGFHRLSESPASDALQREACLSDGLMLLAGRHTWPARLPRPAGREPRAVQAAREYLDEHAGDNVTLRELAWHTGLTPSYLCRVFRRATGMTPHGYQVQTRVRRARTLLLEGWTIAQAAAEAGFCDQAHLTRHFKCTVGLSPGRYIAGLDTRPHPGPPAQP
jgi:AraC-like DNA-binding protein